MITFKKPDVRSFLKTFQIGLFAVSPDEQTVAFKVDFTGVPEVWAMDLKRRFPYQLTNTGQTVYDLRFSKDGTHLYISFDNDGDEDQQVYAIPKEGGQVVPLLREEKTKFIVHAFSEDGKRMYYGTNQTNKTFFDLCVMDVETRQSETLLEGTKAMTMFGSVSKDEQTIIYTEMYSNTVEIGYLLHQGKSEPLIPDAKEHVTNATVLLDDGRVLLATNHESDQAYLAIYNSATKEFTKLVEMDGESVTELVLAKDEKTVYLVTSAGVQDKLYAYTIETGMYEEINLPVTSIAQITMSRAGKLYLNGSTATKPSNLYKQNENEWEQLTDVAVLGVEEADMVEPEVIRYRSFDEKEIEGLFFKPKQEKDNGYTIVFPHGGPQHADVLSFSSWHQILAYEGYRVYSPNYRGSTRYGAEYTKLVERDWGDGPRFDILAGLDFLSGKGDIEEGKLIVLGGSYGGYMSLLLHGRHPERFTSVVDICGVSNLFSFSKSVPESWKPIMERWVGHPERDKEKMTEDSPVTYLAQMTKPMLVVQGANDPRVVKEESDQIVNALREQGTDVDYLVFDDEGHGFTKLENRITMFETILEFLHKHRK
ncbi:dipeptidyl aminopeptidase/acylaminoacyl peptidase [Alkalihalobacillus xiaoxiensis]|uniref:Dipeptidyl aminopeptidase/acylaminoacyl peptidase n=1 Tax=Shouchella xiaoxiensis TaxID=766895 RepID=A0ABS2SRW4_9BACI|nr:S9 family peptidase [Shouchella xiaoxiensis]MBM7837249.1 dipeptidyl aminopeptidase/acylaminoacyl peptidase [Shouchella xiaoxiensis]